MHHTIEYYTPQSLCLDQIKSFLRITHNSHDDIIKTLLYSAISTVNTFTRNIYFYQYITCTIEFVENIAKIKMPVNNATKILSVKYHIYNNHNISPGDSMSVDFDESSSLQNIVNQLDLGDEKSIYIVSDETTNWKLVNKDLIQYLELNDDAVMTLNVKKIIASCLLDLTDVCDYIPPDIINGILSHIAQMYDNPINSVASDDILKFYRPYRKLMV